MKKFWKSLYGFCLLAALSGLAAFGLFSALSADAKVSRKETGLMSYPVAGSSTQIYKGAYVCINASGYLVPASDATALRFAGIAYENVLNTGSNGAKDCRVWTGGVFKKTATSITQAMVGQPMYIVDDATFDDTSTYLIPCGKLVEYVSATSGWVEINATGAARTQTVEVVQAVKAHAAEGSGWTEGVSGLVLATNISDKDVCVPVDGLNVGDIITGFKVAGGIGATDGNATVLDVKLVKVVGVAGGDTDTDVQAMTQLSKTADYKVDETVAVATPETVATKTGYYFFITGTTANNVACDISLVGLSLVVTRAQY